ncbi:hypothetical protein DL95DRAFT_291593, partial [Leptodontidium sp. 2 PMI_412]
MINKTRFLAARRLGLNGPSIFALQYAMWSIAASVSPKYGRLCEVFLQRARKYTEQIELDGIGEPQITIYDAQSWCLIANVEARGMHITRAWTSTGNCICTDLPTSEASFDCGYEEATVSLAEAIAEGGASNILSSFSGVILATTLMAREYNHIQQAAKFEHSRRGSDEEFWKKHRELDNSLSNTLMHLPERFKVAHELRDPNVVFLGIALQAATICLHRTVINRSTNPQVYSSIVSQSMTRCTAAAHAITNTIRLVSRQNMFRMSPWTGFCLYVAGFV